MEVLQYTFAVQPISWLVKGERVRVGVSCVEREQEPRHSCAVSAPKISLFYLISATISLPIFKIFPPIELWQHILRYSVLVVTGERKQTRRARVGVSSCLSSSSFRGQASKPRNGRKDQLASKSRAPLTWKGGWALRWQVAMKPVSACSETFPWRRRSRMEHRKWSTAPLPPRRPRPSRRPRRRPRLATEEGTRLRRRMRGASVATRTRRRSRAGQARGTTATACRWRGTARTPPA